LPLAVGQSHAPAIIVDHDRNSAGLGQGVAQTRRVSSSTSAQIRLVLQDVVIDYTADLKKRLDSMYSDHSAKGRLHSGATVQVAVRAMDELASVAAEQMSTKVRNIARGTDAYSAFRAGVDDLLECFRNEMPRAIRMASGRQPSKPSPSIERAAYELFGQMESNIGRKVKIAKFDFISPSAAAAVPETPPAKQKTGRPRGAFWDDMWAAIAFDLYEGNLDPRSQADVEHAMLRWIEDNGHSAAVSTVRARARRLWDRVQLSD